MGQTHPADVKPLVLEHLDPRYHAAKARGDEKEAQRLKDSWEETEKETILVLGTFLVPGLVSKVITKAAPLVKPVLKKIRKSVFSNGVVQKKLSNPKLPVGRKGAPLKEFTKGITRNTSTIINGRKFTGHALDQMQNRGILSPGAVLDVIKNPLKTMQGKKPNTTVFLGDKLKVVLNKFGDVITVVTQ